MHVRLAAQNACLWASQKDSYEPEAMINMVLHGRSREQAAIGALLRRAGVGLGGGVVMRGEPGVGKTALLDHAEQSAPAGMLVLRAAGVEPEVELGYATLHGLLQPVLTHIDRLPPAQSQALGAVFGHIEGSSPDPLLVSLAALSLLADLAGQRPLLCMVDDAHWADRSSMAALNFVAQRVAADQIALIVAARTGEGLEVDMAGFEEIELAGLDQEAARAVLLDHGGDRLSLAEQDAILAATAGNPLAICEAVTKPRQELRQATPMPLEDRLQQAFSRRARQHDRDSRRLLLLIAVEGSGRIGTIERAAEILGVGTAALRNRQLDELITVTGSVVAFRHPLIRSAVYHGVPAPLRQEVHRALATALGTDSAELDRRAWHLAHAASEPDSSVAAELEQVAARAMRRAGPAAAAVALNRSAELTAAEPERARRLIAAANAWWKSGDAELASVTLEHAERLGPLTPTVQRDTAGLRAQIALRAGTPTDAVELLRPVIPLALRTDLAQAIELLLLFGEASLHANAVRAWAEIAEALEQIDLSGPSESEVLARLFRGACRTREGREAGLQPGDLDAATNLTDPAKMCWAGSLAGAIGEPELGRKLHNDAVRLARRLGAAGTLAWALEYLVLGDLAIGKFAAAEAWAEEGLRFANDSGQINLTCWYYGSLALISALRGKPERTHDLAKHVLEEAAKRDLAAATALGYRALGLLELANGRPGEAYLYLLSFERSDFLHPAITLRSVPDLVEAAVRANEPSSAVEGPLQQFTRWAEATDSVELRALAARCRGLLAEGDAATDEFQVALRLHEQIERPMDHARTHLLLGQHLRRDRRRSESRPHLRAALETFRRLGASDWANTADNELRLTGESARRQDTSALATLTPQELRVAIAVREGATNVEIAAQLFLSPRTVAYHLRNIFHKTGVRSRVELVGLPLDELDYSES